MSPTVRLVDLSPPGDDGAVSADLVTYVDTLMAAFHVFPEAGEPARRARVVPPGRTWLAEDGATPCGTCCTFPSAVTLPGGGVLGVGALTHVGVLASHRRRGVAGALMRAQLTDAIERGEPASVLLASEAGIYGRFGYGPATETASIEVETRRVRMRPEAADAADTVAVRFVTPDELARPGRRVYDAHAARQPGAMAHSDLSWGMAIGTEPLSHGTTPPTRWALATDGRGRPVGYTGWRVEERWDARLPRGRTELVALVALTPAAYAALWRLLLSLDLVEVVAADDRPVEEPLPWLLDDPRRVRTTARTDYLWVRLLDVAAALEARSWAGPGRVVLEVVDGMLGRGGRLAIDVDETGRASCRPTRRRADVTLGIDDLGATVLGGRALGLVAGAAGRVDEHTAGALPRFDRMAMTPLAPWCHVWF